MIVVPVILVVMIGFSSSLDSANSRAGHGNDHYEYDDPCESDNVYDDYGCEIFCPCKGDEKTCEWTEFGCSMKSCKPKIEGCETICPIQCNDEENEIYCPNWNEDCEVEGHCTNYEDSMCQSGWHDDTTDDGDYFYNFESKCIDGKGESFGDAKICVPQRYKYKIKMAPKPPSNKISIVLSNVQITEIADKLGQMTLLMDLEIKWNDSRIDLVKESVPIFLGKDDQNRIWSPGFRIGTDLVSHRKQTDEEFILKQHKNITSVRKISYVSATIKCEMQFHNFPFDNHDCIFEVRKYLSNNVRKYHFDLIYCL